MSTEPTFPQGRNARLLQLLRDLSKVSKPTTGTAFKAARLLAGERLEPAAELRIYKRAEKAQRDLQRIGARFDWGRA